ncbi:ABC transporter substrate-binding protein [Paralimibaculum aggregatum]|uniref:ABC transporter substrate-binding protein n=1 Tax=Paralimibaculum aggregatum TaxID=3036245 RepID=A0ABQ6LTJ0_9RHOB|nr:ABC transporter substrate-binding protein [Limibaculum sp. NKW23]GMG85391.1 ABC transporter substrate-binding protein [Limibaculum sp. NKW23]
MTRKHLLAAAVAAAIAGQAGAAETVRIGELHPITGPASYYGLPESQAIRLAAEQINAAGGLDIGGETRMIEIVSGDTQASPTGGVAALRKLMADGVQIIIGPLSSGVAPALTPIIASADVVQIVDGSIAEGLTDGRRMFRNQATVGDYNLALERLAKARGYDSVAIMTDRFHAGFMESQDDLTAVFSEQGNAVVAEEYYKLGDTDFSGQLTTIAGADPDALIVRGYPSEGALITRQVRDLGYEGQIVWEMVSPPSTVMKNIDAATMEGVLNAIPPTTEDYLNLGNPRAIAMAEAYEATYGSVPGELAALSFDALHIVAAAIEKAGSIEPADIAGAMATLTAAEVPALINTYGAQEDGRLFDETGQVSLPGAVSVWQGEGWVPLTDLAAD